MEGIHISGPTQEPFIQNDDEDEVDAGQEAQAYICQQEGQVEALWAEGRKAWDRATTTALLVPVTLSLECSSTSHHW